MPQIFHNYFPNRCVKYELSSKPTFGAFVPPGRTWTLGFNE